MSVNTKRLQRQQQIYAILEQEVGSSTMDLINELVELENLLTMSEEQ